jgi:hypothetical protein
MLSTPDEQVVNMLMNTSRLLEQGECTELMGEEAAVFIKYSTLLLFYDMILEIPTTRMIWNSA